MDEDPRFVLDIAVLEVAMSFLFFCVKKYHARWVWYHFFRWIHTKNAKNPQICHGCNRRIFFFRKIDILWINRGFPGSPPWLAPLMDREPTMDAMLLCLGGAMKTPPVSWAQGLKSAKLLANHCCVFLFFCGFDVQWFNFGPQFFVSTWVMGSNKGLKSSTSTKAFHPRGIKDLLRRVSKSVCSWTLPGSAWCRGPSTLGSALVTACIQGNCCGYGGKESNLWWTARWRLQSLNSMLVAVAWGSPVGVGAPCDWCGG